MNWGFTYPVPAAETVTCSVPPAPTVAMATALNPALVPTLTVILPDV